MKAFVIAVFFAALIAFPVAAQTPTTLPTPTFSASVLATEMAREAAIDALPQIDQLWTAVPAEVTVEAPSLTINTTINEAPDIAPVLTTEPTEPAPASIPADTVHVALVVGGIITLAVIGVAAFLLKTTGEQLYNSLPPIARYGVEAGGEYLLHEAAKTPQPDDDEAVESVFKALGFVVVREEDGSITLRRPAPVAQGPMTFTAQTATTSGAATTFTPSPNVVPNAVTEADVRRIVAEQYALGTPLSTPPQQPSAAVEAFTSVG